MSFASRFKPALFAVFKHSLVSLLVALVVAGLVLGLWYPKPFGTLAGGQGLFWLVMGVDVVCGPLLTLVVFNPAKPRAELVRDIGLVVLIQLAALIYGLNSVVQARPVWLAFEGNRFRVVSVPDLANQKLDEAPEKLRQLSWTGPKLLAAELTASTDPNFQQSVLQSMAGLHPAFRPSRWRPYETAVGEVRSALQPMDQLIAKQPSKAPLIGEELKGLNLGELGYLPLVSGDVTDWVVVVRRDSAAPIAYLPVDGY